MSLPDSEVLVAIVGSIRLVSSIENDNVLSQLLEREKNWKSSAEAYTDISIT